MRTVVYFRDGVVGDFVIAEDRFTEFSAGIAWEKRYDEGELGKARAALGAFMARPAETPVGPAEELAACFVWNYFNTHPEESQHIDDDILIIDMKGDGSEIEYAPLSEVELAQEQ